MGFPSHLCLIIPQCPLLATLIQSVSYLKLDRSTILLPQYSSSTIKSLLSLFYTGKCLLSRDSELDELKQIMEAVGLDAGMEDFEIVTVEGEFIDMEETASNNNKTMDTAGHNIKIEIELKYDPEEDFGNELSRARDDGIQEYSSDSTSNDLEGGLGLSSAGQSCFDLPDVQEQFETTIPEHRFSRYALQILSQQICPAGMSGTDMSTQKEGPVTTPPPQDLSRI